MFIGDDGWFHQVIDLSCTEATSIDFAPDTLENWRQLSNAIEIQQNYETKHVEDMECQMPTQFAGDTFSSDLIKFNKIPLIERKFNQFKLNANEEEEDNDQKNNEMY